MGYEPVIAPLLAIRPLPQAEPDLTGVTALAFTSPNGVAAFARLSQDRSLPVLAVGDATAAAAAETGFADVVSAAGDLIALTALIREQNFAADAVILNVGAREPAGDMAAALGPSPVVRRLSVYEAMLTDVATPSACVAALVHSPRAGRALAARMVDRDDARSLICIAISPAAAAPLADLAMGGLHAASHPDENSLLATLGKALSPV